MSPIDEVLLQAIEGAAPQHVDLAAREESSKGLNLDLATFDRLITSANKAYTIIKALGPFYGREDIKEPTFRITAEPVRLPSGSYELLKELGNDLLIVADALKKLPNDIKLVLGQELDFNIPLTWRIDAIIDKQNELRINEIEGQDGACALMIAEQLAYNLQTLNDSTASKFINTLKKINHFKGKEILKVAWIRVENNCSPNAKRFIDFIHHLSNNTIQFDYFDEETVRSGIVDVNWKSYDSIINETSMPPALLYQLGVQEQQLIIAGNFSAIANKGVFALLFDATLAEFWNKEIGAERLTRLKKHIIPSKFIRSKEDLNKAREDGNVVKVSWAGTNTNIINRSRGVALPVGELEHSSDERWKVLEELFDINATVIAQDYIEPKKINAYLRKRGVTIVPVEWYNRVCIKYVVTDNPNAATLPSVDMTAVEVTLGPDIIPAGRACAFTAGTFE